ncbi:hypothetical protein GCM10022381_04130 [Leifsonia kafniensis]|uniref:Energy-coupling factor transporter transmembrane protein EcfT n=1 Tax=Leifsonia kafniensis TaxID=475957 RepID=A0ABP7K3F8_9MICO
MNGISVGGSAISSPLARRNPTVKLALLFLVSCVLLVVFDPVTPTVLYLSGLLTVLVFAEIPARTLLLSHLPFLGFALGLLIVNALSRPGDVLVEAEGVRVTTQGLYLGAALAMRTLAIGILSIAFVATTDGVALMTSLNQHARLSAPVTYAVLAGYRMLQRMPREWQTIRQAQAVREPLRADGTVRFGVRNYSRAAFALLVASIRRGERTAQSLESRGLGLHPRSVWRPIALGRADWLMFGGVVVTVLGVVAVLAACGLVRGPAMLAS